MQSTLLVYFSVPNLVSRVHVRIVVQRRRSLRDQGERGSGELVREHEGLQHRRRGSGHAGVPVRQLQHC